MALNVIQQFQELISKSNNILICFKKDFTYDAVAGALALGNFLNKQEKRFNIVCSNFKVPPELSFLPGINEIKDRLVNLRQFIISLDLEDKKIDEFSYDVKDNELKIYILPEEGDFDRSDVKVSSSAYRFDLIIILDTPDLESLGKIYFDQSDFFFATPIINIDHNVNNENYGQINLINLTAASLSEILYHLISETDDNLIDKEIATLLLTGMISKSQGFRTSLVTPQTLHIASLLISKGADKEKIIANLFRTKTLATLKLWGRVLARLQHDPHLKLVWSVLPHSDFVKAGASEENIRGVVEELIANSPQAEIVLLLYEKPDSDIGGQLYTTLNYDSRYLLNNFDIEGTKNFVSFVLKNKTLQEAEAEVVNEIRNKLEK